MEVKRCEVKEIDDDSSYMNELRDKGQGAAILPMPRDSPVEENLTHGTRWFL